ncbi:Sperm-associated antigen 17 [Borealophlyctis nickersoniae]|nr:Sperm-associated antigen 17 [Borealophlyctis nickersoniae]
MGRGDKTASASPASMPLQNAPLNDDTWETFLFAIQEDRESTGDSTARYQPLYDSVASGYRQRFSVIDKTELFSWASDNAKAYDVCKELNGLLDSGTRPEDVPDTLVARALKLRLIILKQDGVEAKNAAKNQKETPETTTTPLEAADAKGGKPGKKEEKKEEKKEDKTKAAAPPKKGAKGAPAKAPDQPSRPQSAQPPQETSKRKTKLRDQRTGKADNRSASIGDEPPEGPDAYYLLKDFNSPGIFNCLMEENDIQMSLLIRLEGMPEDTGDRPGTSPDSNSAQTAGDHTSDRVTWRTTSDPTIVAMRQAAADAPSASSWKQLAWCDISASRSKDFKDLFDVIAKEIYALLEKRKMYDGFYSNDALISIPDIEAAEAVNSLRYYEHLLRAAPSERVITMDVVLAMVLEQVARSAALEDEGDSGSGDTSTVSDQVGLLRHFFDKTVAKLAAVDTARPKTSPEKSVGSEETGDGHPRIRTIPYGDIHAVTSQQLHTLSNLSIDPDNLLTHIQSTFTMTRYQRAMSHPSRTNPSEQRAIARERLLHKTNIQRVSKVHPGLMSRALLQFDFEELLRQKAGMEEKEWNLDAWCWVENLDRRTLTQVLQDVKVHYPNVIARLCRREGLLLLAMLGPGGPASTVHEEHSDSQVKTKVGFGLFYELIDTGRHYLDPPRPEEDKDNASNVRPYAYVAGDQIIQRHDDSTVMYPNTGAQITVHKVHSMHAGNVTSGTCPDVYCSVVWDNNTITWAGAATSKSGPYLTATFRDGSAFSIAKRGDQAALSVQASTRDGLFVEFINNGHVLQKLFSLENASAPGNVAASTLPVEKGRILLPSGVILKYMDDGSIEILYPDGNVSRKRKPSTWTSINQEGTQLTTDADGTFQTTSLKVIRETHPAIKQVIFTREDMVNVAVQEDGQTVAEHGDGTVITTAGQKGASGGERKSPPERTVKVEKPGFAAVTFVNDGSGVCVEMPNGTVIERTALENGEHRFRIRDADKSMDVYSNGSVKLSPSWPPVEESGDKRGGYTINWVDGTLHTVDWLGNVFEIDKAGEAKVTTPESKAPPSPPFTTSLSQTPNFVKTLIVDSPPPPTSTAIGNAPRLFIIREDGSGAQLLRDVDLDTYFRDQLADSTAEIGEEGLPGDPAGLCVTVMSGVGKGNEDSMEAERIVTYRQLIRFTPLDANSRASVLADVEACQTWAESKDAVSAQYAPRAEADAEGEAVARELEEREGRETRREFERDALTFGKNRSATEEAIVRRYKLKQEALVSAKLERLESPQTAHPIHTLKRPKLLRRSAESQKGSPRSTHISSAAGIRTTRPSVVTVGSGNTVIPNYFESPEGRAFLTQSAKEEKLRPKPTSQKTAPSEPTTRDEGRDTTHTQTPRTADREEPVPIAASAETNVEEVAEPNQSLVGAVEQDANEIAPQKPAPLPSIKSLAPSHPPQPPVEHTPPPHPHNPTEVNVLGQPRSCKVLLPSSIRGTKPRHTDPNAHFLNVEAAARRKVQTASTAAGGTAASLGAFTLLPAKCRFGSIHAGVKYRTSLLMTNTGNDSTRFRIKVPKDAKFSVSYKPGPVAPGMHTKVHIDITPVVGKVNTIKEEFQIVTETEILHVPVTASILPPSSDPAPPERPGVLIVQEGNMAKGVDGTAHKWRAEGGDGVDF